MELALLLVAVVVGRLASRRAHVLELAVEHVEILTAPPRHEPAMTTRLASGADGLALRAFEKPARWRQCSRLLRRRARLAIRFERPLDRVFDEAVHEDGAGVIEDEAVILALGGTKSAADHLPEQTHRLRRSRQHDAADIREIEAFGQHLAVGHDLDVA